MVITYFIFFRLYSSFDLFPIIDDLDESVSLPHIKASILKSVSQFLLYNLNKSIDLFIFDH
jgi:hypothetical protein